MQKIHLKIKFHSLFAEENFVMTESLKDLVSMTSVSNCDSMDISMGERYGGTLNLDGNAKSRWGDANSRWGDASPHVPYLKVCLVPFYFKRMI